MSVTGSYFIHVIGDCAERMKSLRISQGGRDIRDGNDHKSQEIILGTITEPYTFEVTARDPEQMKAIAGKYTNTSTDLTFIELNPQGSSHLEIKLGECRITGFEHGSGWGELLMNTLRGVCNTVTYADTSQTTITQLTVS